MGDARSLRFIFVEGKVGRFYLFEKLGVIFSGQVIKNDNAVEINLVVNGQDIDDGQNILMDVPEKHTGITHLAFRVESIIETLKTLEENDIAISQGPVTFGGDGHVSVFVRDPDRNTLEFRGRMEDEDEIPGLVFYDPNE